MSKPAALKQLPWDEISTVLETAIEAGWERDATLDSLTELLDQLLDFSTLIPKPAVGLAVEAIDGPVIRAALGLAWAVALRRINKGKKAGA